MPQKTCLLLESLLVSVMEEGKEHRYYNTNSLLFVANLTSLNPLIEFTLSVIVLFCSGYLLGSEDTD